MRERDCALVEYVHEECLAKARPCRRLSEANDEFEYRVMVQLFEARSRAGLGQDAVAERVGTTTSAILRLEGGESRCLRWRRCRVTRVRSAAIFR